MRTVGVALFIREMMMLAVYRNPFPGDDAREQNKFQVHEQGNESIQFQTSMCQVTVQINGREKYRHLQDYDGDQNHPEQTHVVSRTAVYQTMPFMQPFAR